MLKSSRVWIVAALAAVLTGVPAEADIKAFNEKVKAQDYKGAASEAAATWPTLDKSRKDIAIIANEFGFWTYLAGDFAGAQTFAKFAMESEQNAGASSDVSRATSTVLLRLAEYAVKPSRASRDVLMSAVRTRTDLPGVDTITYLAFEAIIAQDFQEGKWAEAVEASQRATISVDLAGPAFNVRKRRFQLFGGVAEYMRNGKKETYEQIDMLQDAIRNDINTAVTDANAAAFVEVYWDTAAWRETIRLHLLALNKMKDPKRTDEEIDADYVANEPTERERNLLGMAANRAACRSEVRVGRLPDYPLTQLYSGMQGVVILKTDLDAKGKASNTELLSVVPDKEFGKIVLRSVSTMKYVPGKVWGASCSLEQKGRVVTFVFSMG